MPKMETVLVYCLNVDSDGYPVDRNGNSTIGGNRRKPLYTWEKQRRGEKWLAAHPDLWKPVK